MGISASAGGAGVLDSELAAGKAGAIAGELVALDLD
jgi:hypothetical protein